MFPSLFQLQFFRFNEILLFPNGLLPGLQLLLSGLQVFVKAFEKADGFVDVLPLETEHLAYAVKLFPALADFLSALFKAKEAGEDVFVLHLVSFVALGGCLRRGAF